MCRSIRRGTGFTGAYRERAAANWHWHYSPNWTDKNIRVLQSGSSFSKWQGMMRWLALGMAWLLMKLGARKTARKLAEYAAQ